MHKQKFQDKLAAGLFFTSVNDFFCKYVPLGLKNVYAVVVLLVRKIKLIFKIWVHSSNRNLCSQFVCHSSLLYVDTSRV